VARLVALELGGYWNDNSANWQFCTNPTIRVKKNTRTHARARAHTHTHTHKRNRMQNRVSFTTSYYMTRMSQGLQTQTYDTINLERHVNEILEHYHEACISIHHWKFNEDLVQLNKQWRPMPINYHRFEKCKIFISGKASNIKFTDIIRIL
jgi:5-hydroxyisourate hydrolase-like protein (transthyretin family)